MLTRETAQLLYNMLQNATWSVPTGGLEETFSAVCKAEGELEAILAEDEE